MKTECAGAEHMVLSFHQTGESGVLGLGRFYRGLGINKGLMADIAAGERSHSSAFYSDFISVLMGRSLCHFFMCFSKVL